VTNATTSAAGSESESSTNVDADSASDSESLCGQVYDELDGDGEELQPVGVPITVHVKLMSGDLLSIPCHSSTKFHQLKQLIFEVDLSAGRFPQAQRLVLFVDDDDESSSVSHSAVSPGSSSLALAHSTNSPSHGASTTTDDSSPSRHWHFNKLHSLGITDGSTLLLFIDPEVLHICTW
jgi:hypothetical protein